MGCFYCDEHSEAREAIMMKVGDMKAGTLYLFKDQAHKGRCVLALGSHKKELFECDEQERNDFMVRRHQPAPAFPPRAQVRGRL